MDIFFFKLLLSFLTGAAVVTLTTTVSERASTKLGGIITGMPSTSVVAIIFIAWTQGEGAAIESTYAMPLGIAAAAAFVLVYFFTLERWKSFLPSLILSLFGWLVLAIPAMVSRQNIFASSIVYITVFLLLCYFVAFKNKLNPQAKRQRADKHELLFRALFGGFVISLAVIMARFAGPLYGGAFGTFPAVFSSTFVILHHKHGSEFMKEFMRTIPLGSLSAFTFIVSANHFCQSLGLITGLLIAYSIGILPILFLRPLFERNN
jgi:hypothetical protein